MGLDILRMKKMNSHRFLSSADVEVRFNICKFILYTLYTFYSVTNLRASAYRLQILSSCSVEMELLRLILVYILVSSAKCNSKFLKFEEKSLIQIIKMWGQELSLRLG